MKRILFGMGGGPYVPVAMEYALELARRHGASITGLAVLDLVRLEDIGSIPIGGGAAAHQLREHRIKQAKQEADAVVAQFQARCSEAGVEHRLVQASGDPVEQFISCSRYHDLVVCGLQRIFEFGPVEDTPNDLVRLITEGVRPILAVTQEYRPIRNVVIAYSGSSESAKNMKRFVELHLWPDMKLKLITFQAPEKGNALLQDAADYCRAHGYEVETEVLSGSAQEKILPFCDNCDADLIVVGNSAKNLLIRKIFGETALHVMRNSTRPLFLGQ